MPTQFIALDADLSYPAYRDALTHLGQIIPETPAPGTIRMLVFGDGEPAAYVEVLPGPPDSNRLAIVSLWRADEGQLETGRAAALRQCLLSGLLPRLRAHGYQHVAPSRELAAMIGAGASADLADAQQPHTVTLAELEQLATTGIRTVPAWRRVKSNVFFPLTAAAAALFVFTIFAYATMSLPGGVRDPLAAPDAPLAKWLNRWLETLLLVEVLAVLALGTIALAIDRRRMLRACRTVGR